MVQPGTTWPPTQPPWCPAREACACTAVRAVAAGDGAEQGDDLDGLVDRELLVLLRVLVIEGEPGVLQRADGAQLRHGHPVPVGHGRDLRQQVAAEG